MEGTIPKLLRRTVRDYSSHPAQFSKDSAGEFHATSFSELFKEVCICAAGLQSIGIKRKDHVGLISDNRKEWFITDLALLCLGAADVPRGCDSTAGEITYILSFADCRTVILENESQLKKVLENRGGLPLLKTLILFDSGFDTGPYAAGLAGMHVYGFGDIMEKGRPLVAADAELIPRAIDQGGPEDLATIIFTSGTTGEPKGVMLSHRNFLHQVKGVPKVISAGPGDIWLCVLPV